MKNYYRVKAEINLDAVYENVLNAKKKLSSGTLLCGIVKADGYGHGAVQVARTIDSLVDWYGVAVLEEGIELRKNGIKKPVLILGYTPEPLYPEMIEYDIDTAVFTYEMAEKISEAAVKAGKPGRIHIALDTGMSRIGFKCDEKSAEIIRQISALPGIQIDGCFSHFATMDEKDKTKAYAQFRKFREMTDRLEAMGVNIPIKHIANSAAIMEAPDTHMDMARDGICVYGLYPSEEVDKSKLLLKPAMEIKAYVSYVKTLEPGVEIGYGGTYTTSREARIATIPVGYADGYPRSLSNKGSVLIHGKRAKITGRICMDQFMVDVTDIPDVKTGDEVTLIGRDGSEFISVEEAAGLSGSFNYEFVCDIGKRVPREYFRNGKKVGDRDYF